MVSNISYLNTKQLLQESGAFAEGMLHPNNGSRNDLGSTVVHHHHYDYHPWGWNFYPQPTYYVPSFSSYRSSPSVSYSGSSSENSSKEKEDNSWLAIPAAIIALGTLYFAGQNYSEWQQANNGIDQLNEKITKANSEINSSQNSELNEAFDAVCEKQMNLFSHIRSDAKQGLFWKGLLASSSIAVLTGAALIEAPALVTAGLIGGGISLAAMLWRSGVRSMDTSIKQEAQALQIAVQQANQVLEKA